MNPGIQEPTSTRTLPDLLARQVRLRPGKAFLTYLNKDVEQAGEFTFAEIEACSNRVAAYLQKIGIKRGDAVCLHMPNVPEFIFAWFGIAKVGAFMVATNLKSVPDEMEYFLTHSESKALIAHTEFMDQVEPILGKCPGIREIILSGDESRFGSRTPYKEILASKDVSFDMPRLDPLDTCAVLYTSGTTSRPKGVMITHANYVWASEVQVRTQMLTENDRYLVCLPYFHINAQTYSTLPTLSVGGSIVMMERFSKTKFWDMVARQKPTCASFVPALYRMLELHEPGSHEKNHSFRLWGGGMRVARLEERFGIRSIGWFGMTETVTVPVATSPIDDGKPGAVGFANVGYRVRIMGDDGKPCPPGVSGELEIWGVPGISLMKGYLKNPEATAETVSPDGWLKTGDNVVADEEGYITYVNRKKDMLKVGGENVAASEIERVAMMHPAVYEAAAIGIRDHILGEVPKVFIILHEGKTATEQEIIEFCKGKLATFKVPREVEFRDSFPRSTLEKVSKKQLKEEDDARRKNS